MTQPADLLRPFLARQNGVVTTLQAASVGVSPQQLRTLRLHGWAAPIRDVLIEPSPRHPFRSSLRAALLVRPEAAASDVSAARLFKLSGLPLWTPAEHPDVCLPAKVKRAQREGM